MPSSTKKHRDYSSAKLGVQNTYKKQHRYQTLSFIHTMHRKYTTPAGTRDVYGNAIRMSFMEAFKLLETLKDESDPDTGLPQIVHAFQTGEALRQQNVAAIRVKELLSPEEWNNLFPDEPQSYEMTLQQLYPHITDWAWLPLVGLIHDLGKVLATPRWGKLPQWNVVGDTLPVGAPFSASNVFAENGFFKRNPDLVNQTQDANKFGIYARNCGFENVQMMFGHDEYLYSVLKNAYHRLPQEALYIVRFHSFYPWHTPPQNMPRAYGELANQTDRRNLLLLKVFQKSDLYSKREEKLDLEKMKEYYNGLIERFIPGRPAAVYNLRPAKIRW